MFAHCDLRVFNRKPKKLVYKTGSGTADTVPLPVKTCRFPLLVIFQLPAQTGAAHLTSQAFFWFLTLRFQIMMPTMPMSMITPMARK